MLQLRLCLVVFCMTALLAPRFAVAQTNSVYIESMEVLPGATNVTVGVYVSNIVPMVAFTLPLEIREIEAGAFPNSPVALALNPAGRMYNSVLGPNPPRCPPAGVIDRYYAAPAGDPCSGPVSATYSVQSTTPDGQSPDCYLLLRYQVGSEDDCSAGLFFDPDTEQPGMDLPSVQLTFDVPSVSGQFEIDSCCVRPANHLMFVNPQTQIVVPSFTKSIITIGCFCRCHGDPECDGQYDILDIVRTINSAFRNDPALTDPDCTHARTDADASGVTDIVDVTRMIDVVLSDGSVDVNISDPCAQ